MNDFKVAHAQLESIARGERGYCKLFNLRYIPKLIVEMCLVCKEQLICSLYPRSYKHRITHFKGAIYRIHNCFGMGPMCECCTWYAEYKKCSCYTMGEEDLTPKYTPHPTLINQGNRDEDYIAWFLHFNPKQYIPLPTLVDTRVTPLSLSKGISPWSFNSLRVKSSLLKKDKDNYNHITSIFSLPVICDLSSVLCGTAPLAKPLVTPLTAYLTSFNVTVRRKSLYPYMHICTASVIVNSYSMCIQINGSSPSENKYITLTTEVSVRDVLHSIQDQSTWNNCNLILGPCSQKKYDSNQYFFEHGDWVDMGDNRIECDKDDITIISMENGLHSIMTLNPNAIHGGYFEICIN